MGRTKAADGAESGGLGLGVGETVRELREAYESGRTRSLAWRQAQLRGLLRLLEEKEVEAFQALHKDLGKHHAEAYRDEVASRRQTMHTIAILLLLLSLCLRLMFMYRSTLSRPLGSVRFLWFCQVGVLIKSANGALQQLGKWMAPEKASHGNIMVFLLRQSLLSDASVSANAGAGPADRLAGDRAGGAGAARGRPRLLLLERPLG